MGKRPRKLKGHKLTLTWCGEYGEESSSTGTCTCGWEESASSQKVCREEYRWHLEQVYEMHKVFDIHIPSLGDFGGTPTTLSEARDKARAAGILVMVSTDGDLNDYEEKHPTMAVIFDVTDERVVEVER
jgi:hypothetical protein